MHKTFTQRIFLTSWRPYAWVCLAVLLVYGKTLFFQEWTYLDDHHLIVESQPLLSDPNHLLKAFAEDVFHKSQGGMYYRPLLTVSFMLDTFLGGTSPFVYHLSNILYHLFTCLLLMVFFKELKLSNAFAFCATIFFAIHPATAQTVGWIPGRNESLLAIFVLLGGIALVRFDATTKLRWIGAHVVFFALALSTKENALMLAPLSALFLLARAVQGKRFQIGQYALFGLGWVFVILYWHYGRQAAMILGIANYSYAVGSVLSNSWTLFAFYETIVWPWNLFTVAVAEDLAIIPGMLGLLGSTVIVLLAKQKRWGLLFFGFCWFVIFLLPTFYRHPDVIYPTRYFEHRVYLSLIGFLLMAASVSTMNNWKIIQSKLSPAFVVLCLLLGVLTFRHSGSFADAMAFSEQTARTSPRSTFYLLEISMMKLLPSLSPDVNFTKLGATPVEYFAQLHELEGRTLLALEQDTANSEHRLALATIYFAMGRLKSSEAVLHRLLAAQPENITARYNLGVLYYHGHFEKLAEEQWLKTVELDASHADAYRNLCYLYYSWKEFKTALQYAEKAKSTGVTIPQELLNELLSAE